LQDLLQIKRGELAVDYELCLTAFDLQVVQTATEEVVMRQVKGSPSNDLAVLPNACGNLGVI
jgi:hypothetical protein